MLTGCNNIDKIFDMIDLRGLEDSVKFSYTVALDCSKRLSRSSITASVLTVAALAGFLTQFPIFGLAMVEINAAKIFGDAFRANPATSEFIKDVVWTLLAFGVVFLVMIYVAEFWVVRANAATAVSFRLALGWLLDAPLPWFETHVLVPVDVAISTFSGEPININPKLIGSFEGGLTPMLLLPLLAWIAVPYDPGWAIQTMLISAGAMALAMCGMMALGGINLVVEKKWRIGSCVPKFILSDAAVRSRTFSHQR